MVAQSTRRTFSRPGRLLWQSGATTSHSARLYHYSWRQSWRSRRSLSCATFAAEGTRHDDVDGNRRSDDRATRPGTPWQHLARPPEGAILVLFLPDPVCYLLFDSAGLHVYHLAQIERGDLGSDQSVVGIPPHALELHRSADPKPIPYFLS